MVYFLFVFECFVFLLFVFCLDARQGFWGWVRPVFFSWPFYGFFLCFYFLCMLTYFWCGCYDERLSGMVETRNFIFFFPLVFSFKDYRLDIYNYYCYFASVDIAEIEILPESEVTDK